MSAGNKLGEFELIAHLTRSLKRRGDDVVCGVGDDAAVLRAGAGRLLLATCDAQIQGVHFTLDAFPADWIGRRVAAVNLSDIAAMGGIPTFAMVALAVPRNTDPDMLDAVYQGLVAGLDAWGAEIVGGNTAELPERMVIDVALLGEVTEKALMTRAGASPGDILCVTGELGASAAGREIIGRGGRIGLDEDVRAAAIRAHGLPRARISEGRYLGGSGQVTACIDVSDGLYGDAVHIAEASAVALSIDAERIPIARAARQAAPRIGVSPLSLALTGGEDYELLFTVRREAAAGLLDGLRKATGTPVSEIGEVREGPARIEVRAAGRSIDIKVGGFDHFRE